MASSFFLNLFLISSSFCFLGFSETTSESLNGALTQASGAVGLLNSAAQDANNGGVGPNMQCVQKLLPCQPYMHSSPTKPPATCCVPLNEMIKNETQCLCSVIDNPAILKSLNVTKEDALHLAKACGADADLSKCNNATSPTTPPASPTPAPPAMNASSPTPASSACRNSYSGRFAFALAFFAGLIFSTL